MELASLVGVPRTTINDWLGKYSLYITTLQQGKRKVYPESALQVLKAIAALRNDGCSFPEIGERLAKDHPVQPEVSSEGELPLTSENEKKEPSPAGEEKVVALSTHNGEEQTPLKEDNKEETPQLPVLNQAAIEEDFQRLGTALALLSEKLAAAEEKRAKAFRKGMLAVFLPLFVLTLLLGAGSLWYFGKLTSSNEELKAKTHTLSDALDKARKESLLQAEASEKKFLSAMEKSRKEQEKLKRENADSLRKVQQDHAMMMEKLTRATLSAIEKNRREYPRMLEKELNKRLSRKELLWRKERERWAKERLFFLKKLEAEKKLSSPGKMVSPSQKKEEKKSVKSPSSPEKKKGKSLSGKKESPKDKEKKK